MRCCATGIEKRDAICNESCVSIKKPFIKCRPKWLYGLELDGYCKELNLAFEYNGQQHYDFISYFYKTTDELEKRIDSDQIKLSLCIVNDVKLITIPYTIEFNEMENFINQELKKIGYPSSFEFLKGTGLVRL